MRKVASVVRHISLPFMKSFNVTKAAIFPMQAHWTSSVRFSKPFFVCV